MMIQRLLTVGAGLFMLAPSAWAGIPERAPLPVIERHPNDPAPLVYNAAADRIMPAPLPNLHGVALVPYTPPAPEPSDAEGCPTQLSRPELCQ